MATGSGIGAPAPPVWPRRVRSARRLAVRGTNCATMRVADLVGAVAGEPGPGATSRSSAAPGSRSSRDCRAAPAASNGCGTGSPTGGLAGLGTSPASTMPPLAAPRVRLRHGGQQRHRVRVPRAARTARPTSASSTILPRYITADPVADVLDDREVVGDEQVGEAELALEVVASRLRICDWIETSSADTGSSQTMNSGSSASARAMPMRWRWPPRTRAGSGGRSRGAGRRPRGSRRRACRGPSLRPAVLRVGLGDRGPRR